MEFKIGEDFEEEKKEKNSNKENGINKFIIIGCLSVLAFLVVFLLLNSIFSPKNKITQKAKPITSDKISLTESNVKILYGYVTYSTSGPRYDIFVKNNKVTLDTFTEEEKYYYALQYVQVKDFTYTGRKDEDNNKIYSISNRKIKKYMEYFFGQGVKYSTDVVAQYPFSFSINGKNVGTLKYNEETDAFETIFEKEESYVNDYVVEPYMGKLVDAYKDPDGGYRIMEKIIYVKAVEQDDGKYEVTISKDYDHKNVIKSIVDQTKTDLEKIKIDDYIDKAATITYTFKLKGTSNVLYFYSSEIN